MSLPEQAVKNIDINVEHGPLGIGDPTHSSRGLQAQVVPDDAFHRCTDSDPFGDRWNEEAEFWTLDLITIESTYENIRFIFYLLISI
jgi:hypothetical protein